MPKSVGHRERCLGRSAERTRPCREASVAGGCQLAEAARLDVEYPNRLGASTVGRQRDVPRVGRPRRILILALRGQATDFLVRAIYHPHLEITVLLLVCDHATVRAPIWTRVVHTRLGRSWGLYPFV